MIRVAETRADFERCAEIYNAVEPDRVLAPEDAARRNGRSRPLPPVFVVSGSAS